eukprot:1161587-Pelagomonas_calceolata.AAC.11
MQPLLEQGKAGAQALLSRLKRDHAQPGACYAAIHKSFSSSSIHSPDDYARLVSTALVANKTANALEDQPNAAAMMLKALGGGTPTSSSSLLPLSSSA